MSYIWTSHLYYQLYC